MIPKRQKVPKSPQHQKAGMELVQNLGANVADATLLELYTLSPKYLQALKKSAKREFDGRKNDKIPI